VISLDLADLVVIAGRTLDLDADTVLARLDVAAAETALAEASGSVPAGVPGTTDPADAAAAGVALVRALLVHRPFPRDGMRLAAATGLQFLALNGWRARLEPPETAAVVIEALASGRLSPHAATQWLAPRLSALPAPVAESVPESVAAAQGTAAHVTTAIVAPVPNRPRRTAGAPRQRRRPHPAGARHDRRLISALIAVGLGGLAVLATACTDAASSNAPAPAQHHVSAPR
jgi:prophage maintenance system killer protein